jgi:DNA-binding response OmpR family regulator
MDTLLVVEDERNIRTFIAANLKARGFSVIEAGSAEEGLTLLNSTSPKAVILDILLPGMSGWDLLQIMSGDANLRTVPVVLMTASAVGGMPKESGYDNVVQHLAKPISAHELVAAIHKALAV